MSLINEVLKDIDNKPEAQDQSILGLMQSSSTRSAPKQRLSGLAWLVILLLVVLAAGYIYQTLYSTSSVPFFESNAQFTQAPLSADSSPESQSDSSVQSKQADISFASDNVNSLDGRTQESMEADASVEPTQVEPSKLENVLVSESRANQNNPSFKTASNHRVATEFQPVVTSAHVTHSQRVNSSANALSIRSSEVPPKKAMLKASNRESEVQLSVQAEPVVSPAVSTSKDVGVFNNDSTEVENSTEIENSAEIENSTEAEKKPLKKSSETTSVSMVKTREVTLYEQALTAVRTGQLEQADQLVTELLANRDDPRYISLKARLLLGDSPASLVAYIDQKNLDIGSSDEMLALSASAYQRTGDHTRAVKAYDLLVQREPTEGRWWLAMAFSLETLELFEKSLKSYQFALQSGTLPANARQYAAIKATELNKKIEALAKQAEEQE